MERISGDVFSCLVGGIGGRRGYVGKFKFLSLNNLGILHVGTSKDDLKEWTKSFRHEIVNL